MPGGVDGGRLVVAGAESRHLVRALRAKPGFKFIAIDGLGNGWRAKIAAVKGERVEALAVEELESEPPPTPAVTVAVGVVKGARMDWAVEKAAELGATGFIPLLAAFGSVQPGEGRLTRWRAIAIAAAKQSRRLRLMDVYKPQALTNLLASMGSRQLWVFDTVSAQSFSPKMAPPISGSQGLTALIGPEGGFSNAEREAVGNRSPIRIRLGSHPLRTETAVVAALALLQSLYDRRSEPA